ncbi:MAG: tetratricopeptide repeat protein [Candidatus Electrothrix sp. YB6]
MSETNPYQELLEQLQACESQEERDWLSLRFSMAQLPEELQAAVRAAAVPRFFDRAFLNALLDQPLGETHFAELLEQPYVEPYPVEERYNVHERSRRLLQERLWLEDEEQYCDLSRCAFTYCAEQDQDDLTWQIETIYHQLIAEPDKGADALNNICVDWTNPPYFAYDRAESLLQAVQEHREMKRLPDKAVLYFLLRQANLDMRYSRNRQAKDALEQIPLSVIKEDDSYLAANCLKALGDVHLRLSELPAARKRYEECLPVYREIGSRLGEANCLQALGDVHLRLSELPAARRDFENARKVYRDINESVGKADSLRMLGKLAVQTGEFAAAQKYVEQASAQFERIEGWEGVAECLEGFAELYQAQGKTQQAKEYWQKAADKYHEISMPLRAEKCLEQLRQLKEQE